jgi:NAD(P)-dependent dehydrogenase (short-subunit alcohol dehydrogenase family)
VVAPTRTLTAEGLELQFAVNILSYFLVMVGLSSLLRRSAPARVINVASNLAGDLELDDLQFARRDYDVMTAYKQAKQANRMLTWHAASTLFAAGEGVACNAMHPGVTTSNILTGLGYEQGWDSAEKCAETAVFLATNDGVGAGKYFVACEEKPCQWQGEAEANAALWARCEALAAEAEEKKGGK